MWNRVVVACATRYGSSAEVAETIGKVVSTSGANVDVLPVKEVRDLSLYPAVVLGSAAQLGK